MNATNLIKNLRISSILFWHLFGFSIKILIYRKEYNIGLIDSSDVDCYFNCVVRFIIHLVMN